MDEEGADSGAQAGEETARQTSRVVKVLQYGAIIVIVPFVIALLLAWTIVGRLCSLRPGVILWMVTALVAIPFLVDFDVVNPAGGAGDDPDYAFETNLLDSICVLVGMNVLCFCTLRSSDDLSVEASSRRRLLVLPFTVCAAAYFVVKLVAVSSEGGDVDRWVVAWLWLSLLTCVFAYVSMSRCWTDTSLARLRSAEAALLEEYGKVDVEQTVVAGLGTIRVKDSEDPEWVTASSKSKPLLVLVHGYAAGNGFWMFILRDLSVRFRVLCVEMYGCGRSDRIAFRAKGPEQTERLLVDSLEKWRQAMGIEEMVLCGHSLGGMAVSAYTMAHPHRVRHLMLLSPAGLGGIPDGGDGGGTSAFYKIYAFLWTRGVGPLFLVRWSGPLGTRISRTLLAKRLSWVPESARIREVDTDMLGSYVFQLLGLPASGERLIFPLLSPMLHAYNPVGETLKGRRMRGDGGEEPGISCPVSIIYGSPDVDWMPQRHGQVLAERLTRQGLRAKVYSVPDAGHTLFIDNPEEFTRIFLEAFSDAGGENSSPRISEVIYPSGASRFRHGTGTISPDDSTVGSSTYGELNSFESGQGNEPTRIGGRGHRDARIKEAVDVVGLSPTPDGEYIIVD